MSTTQAELFGTTATPDRRQDRRAVRTDTATSGSQTAAVEPPHTGIVERAIRDQRQAHREGLARGAMLPAGALGSDRRALP